MKAGLTVPLMLAHCAGFVTEELVFGLPSGIQAHCVERWIHDAEVVVLVKKRLLVSGAYLQVVDTLHI